MKILSNGIEDRQKMIKVMDLVEEYVCCTLGPGGGAVTLDRAFSVPRVTTDGVSVAKALEVNDDIERQTLNLMCEAAAKTNEEAGDATTTTIKLCHAIPTEAFKYSDNPKKINKSIEKAKVKIIGELRKIAKPIRTSKEIFQVALVSSESDEIAHIITDTFQAVGKDGKITVEESKLPSTEVKLVEGYEVEKGYVHPFMCNKGNKSEFRNVRTLVIGEKLSTIAELLPFLEKASATIKELVIFCTEIDPAVLNTFAYNKQTGMFNALVVKCPSQKNEVLEDVALVTGATFISKDAGYKLEELTMEHLGKAEKIISTSGKTIILNGSGSVKSTVKQLKQQLGSITNDNDYDMVEKRIARLQGNVAVISVGSKTEGETQGLYDKVEDAVNAVKSALEEGIVEGGGMALYRVSQKLSSTDIGERIMKKAILSPFIRIIDNIGLNYADILVNMPKGKGFDAENECYVDMIKSGIIDPVKATRCSIENAVSFAKGRLINKGTIAVVKTPPKSDE
jgi:chaperonin GroEL